MTLARSFVRSMGRSRRRLLPVVALAALIFTAAGAGLFNGTSATADTGTINFNSYSLGSIHGQDGWSSLGSTGGGCATYDHAVVQQQFVILGNALRISNAVTSGCFSDQTFSRSLVDEAGETSAVNDAMSGGTRQNRFESEFTLASVVPSAQQPGLFVSVSPDRGDGARMSYLGFEDQADGIHVLFYDYQDRSPFGTVLGDPAGCGPEDDFILTDIATLNRSLAHTIKFDMGFVDGSRNDTVKVYLDGNLEITGTSWEDYFRYCEGIPTRTVDSLLFRTGGTAAPATAGNGYLIDDMTTTSSTTASTTTVTTVTASTMGATNWLFYNDENDTVDPTLGSFVAGPGTPDYPTGSAQISVTGTQRRNLASYQFAGTELADITALRFRTYNPSAGNGGSATRSAYLNFNVDFNGSDTWQRRLVFVPSANGTVAQNTWQEWDAIGFGTAKWTYSGPTWPVTGGSGTTPKTWAQILTDYPGVRIRVTDAFLGMRVGEPYADGYTENIDTFTFGTASGTTIFNFEDTPACTTVCYVNATTGNDAFDGSTPTSAKKTIQGGINAVSVGGTVHVAAGTYNEDVAANKVGVQLLGAGIDVSNIVGPIGGAGSTIQVTANGVVVDGFTITRAGNNVTDWNAALNTAGVAVQSQGNTVELRNSKLTGLRTGVDINNSNGNSIHHNIIDNNRTGMIFRNQTDSTLVVNNFITNNWTVGVLFLDGSGGTNVPPQSAALSSFSDNNISGNWYGNAEDRQAGGSVPPAPTNPKNFEFNWWGTTAVTVSTVQGGEPGYSAQIPVIFGGTATPPGGQPEIKGTSSANIDYIQFQCSGVDTSAAIGFQPAGTLCNPPSVTEVTAATMNSLGWAFYNDETDTVSPTLGSFVTGPGTPPYGTGSAQISVSGTQRRNLATNVGAGTPLANITALRFRTYNPSAGNGGSATRSAYLNFNVDFNGSDTFQQRLVYVPSQNGTVVQNSWQEWDAINNGNSLWQYSGPTWPVTLQPGTTLKTWSQILADYPLVRIRPTQAFVGLRVGEPYPDGYTENIDTFTFGTASGTTIFDFEKNDDDADGLEDVLDNCPTINNPGQENTNGEPMPLPKPYPVYDDATNPAGDFVGDACDSDIDGDNVPNLIESMLGLSPFIWDSDGDRTNDGTEIQCGTNPLSAVSNLSGPDTDNDRLPNACEPSYGTNPAAPDTDGDGVRDGVEVRYWMSNPLAVNSDGDGCRDGREVASVNHDHTVNPADLGTIASLFGTLSPDYRPLDQNGDGVINPADLGFVASQYGACTP